MLLNAKVWRIILKSNYDIAKETAVDHHPFFWTDVETQKTAVIPT